MLPGTARRWGWVAAAWLIASGAGRSAETDPVPTALPEMVVSASDTYRSLGLASDPLSVPITASDVTMEELLLRDARTLKDAMAYVPGITIGTGNGVHDFFVVRGIDSLSGGLILMDGVPEPEATFYPLHHIEGVQVLKGPGSFAFGAGSLAGSVNLVRKAPRFERFGSLRAVAGSQSLFRFEGDVGLSLGAGSTALRLNGLYEDRESHRDLIESKIMAFNPSLLRRVGDRGALLVHVDGQRNDVVPDAGVPVVGDELFSDSRSLTFQEPGDDSRQDVFRLYARYDHALSDDAFVRNQSYYTQLDWESEGTVYAGFVRFGVGAEPAPRSLARYRPMLDDEQQIFGNELTLHLRLESGRIAHELQTGVEYTRFTDEFTLVIPPAADIDVLTRETRPSLLEPLPDNAGDAASDIYSVYALDQATLGERWTVLAGVRADWLEFEDDVRGTARSDSQVSPLGGLVFRPREGVSFFVNAGRGFAPPSTQVVGPRGQPEESSQFEGGIKWRGAGGRWRGQLAAYRLDRENIGIPDSFGILTDRGDQESEGVDLEVEAEWTEAVTLYASYAYLDSELTEFTEVARRGVADRSGNTAPFSPEHTFAAWLEWRPAERWTLGAGVRYVDDHFIAPDNAYQIDAYTVADAAVTYQRDRWNVSVQVGNLIDQDVYTRGQSGTSVIPEDGVSVTGALGLSW